RPGCLPTELTTRTVVPAGLEVPNSRSGARIARGGGRGSPGGDLLPGLVRADGVREGPVGSLQLVARPRRVLAQEHQTPPLVAFRRMLEGARRRATGAASRHPALVSPTRRTALAALDVLTGRQRPGQGVSEPVDVRHGPPLRQPRYHRRTATISRA